MKATYKLTDPDSVEATLSATMTIGDWKKLRSQLSRPPDAMSYPNFKFIELIDALVKKAEAEFEAEGAIE